MWLLIGSSASYFVLPERTLLHENDESGVGIVAAPSNEANQGSKRIL